MIRSQALTATLKNCETILDNVQQATGRCVWDCAERNMDALAIAHKQKSAPDCIILAGSPLSVVNIFSFLFHTKALSILFSADGSP
jgi:hypothetical protein